MREIMIFLFFKTQKQKKKYMYFVSKRKMPLGVFLSEFWCPLFFWLFYTIFFVAGSFNVLIYDKNFYIPILKSQTASSFNFLYFFILKI